MEKVKEKPPGGYPKVDDQGKFPTCTIHALSKAIVMGFDQGIFARYKVDISQERVAEVLMKGEKSFDAKFPEEFNGKEYEFEDKTKIVWNFILEVDKVDICDRYLTDLSKEKPQFTYILVYPEQHLNTDTHAVFIEFYDERKNSFSCLNSHGYNNNPKPMIPLNTRGLMLYRIFCEQKNPQPFDLRCRILGNSKRNYGEAFQNSEEGRRNLLTKGKENKQYSTTTLSSDDLRNKLNQKKNIRI